MDVPGMIQFLNQAIASERAGLRFQIYLICALVGTGLGAIVFTVVISLLVPQWKWASTTEWKWSSTLGGLFLPTLSGLPLKDISGRKDRIRALLFIKYGFERVHSDPGHVEAAELGRLEERFWQLIDISLGR